MAHFKVIVPRLNVRKAPVADFADKTNVITTVGNGMVLDLEEITDVPNPALGKWYGDGKGQVYSEKGLASLSTQAFAMENYPVWMNYLKLSDIWKTVTGKDVGVAVLDTGIALDNSDLHYSKTKFYLNSKSTSLQDTNGHGTFCAGLIGAKNSKGYKIGVAPNANLFVCKICDIGYFEEEEQAIAIADAISWCTQNDAIKVISISWSPFISTSVVIQKIQQAVDMAHDKGKIIVAARGNYNSSESDNSKTYPACLKGVISVGVIPDPTKHWFNYMEFKDILIPGININSYSNIGNGLKSDSGTSMSTAIMAGIISLLVEKSNHSLNTGTLKDLIPKISTKSTFNNEELNVINGQLLLNHLTT